MGTVPTGRLERELRALYLRWLMGVPAHQDDLAEYLLVFEARSRALIERLGGRTAALGALADFPAPRTLELSPVAGVIYNEMTQAAIQASIAAGLQSTDAARLMVRAGLEKGFRRLNRLARTETVSAYWQNQWNSVAGMDGIVMVWGAERGKRTCEYCLSRDGLVVEDGNIRDHPNGRCTLIPTPRSKLKYKGTLLADGSIIFDPKYGPVAGKATPLPPGTKPRAAAPGALPAPT